VLVAVCLERSPEIIVAKVGLPIGKRSLGHKLQELIPWLAHRIPRWSE
jgi:hypothetical protein